ncbi:hypothetical protein SAMN05421788_11569 [Filimonas lacunae]|uniref:Reverse transcriptase (RNA-dependent DNA polymerase) n=1 Tax=Filimonas lacunae TaxID=477680 RepID=A0A173MC27_9BACT|nr:RNA-directed DNA polymerase [Filimonas lacunae]BAV05087.1 hypothetical protein FLA_1094 [Filimonas lacunae]SIT34243.1 hypothetical protein SAMN05421788_11569 [Filimonas lacunae]
MKTSKLVTKGFFPEELPPPFNTKDLGKVIKDVLDNPDEYPIETGSSKKKKAIIFKVVPFSTPKIRAYRRTLALPNPLHYIWFSDFISEKWSDIISFTEGSSISLSPLRYSVDTERAIAQPSYDRITNERILRSTGHKYLLKVDILKFYGNIYTHSIPWVLHTKALAKSNRDPHGLLGNKLDWFVRNMQDGQTMGIPVGPDISRIISEIIVAYIDRELSRELGVLEGIRVVDDYSLYFKDLAGLEKARSLIQKLLRDIELDLNQAKEKVILLPEIIESEWYNRLRQFKFSNKKILQTKDIIAYFDLCFHYSEKYPDESILAYSISKMAATVFREENWPILESFLLKSLQVEPKVLPYVVKIFLSHKKEGYELNMDVIEDILNDYLLYHLRLENHFEIVWTLWFIKELEIVVSESAARELSNSSNDVVILTALDLQNHLLIPHGLDTSEWKMLLTAENLYSEHWLLAYEACVSGLLKPETEYIQENPFFKLLKKHKVRFYNADQNLDLSSIRVASKSTSLEKYRSTHEEDDEGDHDFRSMADRLRKKIKRPKDEDLDWED